MIKKQAFFRFEASILIGAGHAIRSCVLADALVERGWICKVVTTEETYSFISNLNRFDRIEPEVFYHNPLVCDLLVIDNYELDQNYEKHFKPYAKKIMVIDDLANIKHDCDILLDQTYGRDLNDYKGLVPEYCKILVGNDYVLLRKEFIQLRPIAIEKRRKTTEIKRILISMGGSGDQNEYILKVLNIIKESRFNGIIDVVLGFVKANLENVNKYIDSMSNKVNIHTHAKMAELIYEADLAIGAAGSSVWERCCLGLPSVLMVLAQNQAFIYKNLIESFICYSIDDLLSLIKNIKSLDICNHKMLIEKIVDGFGINRVLFEIDDSAEEKVISLRTATKLDLDMVFGWQNIKEIRQYFNSTNIPSYFEHSIWFDQRLKESCNPYWIICEKTIEVGVVSLTYNFLNNYYDLSWYLIPNKQSKGIGTRALKQMLNIIKPFKVHAFVNEENIASHKSLQKIGFKTSDTQNYFFDWSISRC